MAVLSLCFRLHLGLNSPDGLLLRFRGYRSVPGPSGYFCTSVRSVASGASSRLYSDLRINEDTREVSDALCSLQVLHQKGLVSWTNTEKQCVVLAAVE
jgi:hypothetical protein